MLETGQEFTLLAIDGGLGGQSRDAPTNEKVFHGYPILGAVKLEDAEGRTELLEALYRGIAECNHPRAICFEPGFAISATRDDEIVDLVICFECGGIDVFAPHGRDVVTTALPLAAFQRIGKKHGLPVPE